MTNRLDDGDSGTHQPQTDPEIDGWQPGSLGYPAVGRYASRKV